MIVGSSGSGKTSLACEMFGGVDTTTIDGPTPIIDQFPEEMTYDQCVAALTGMGLTSIPCWVRPAHTLSTGQRARATASLAMRARAGTIVLDEWTSVVDRDVAKVMSHAVQKYARGMDKKVVLLSCHRDVIEWVNPDWIIDCNKGTFENRRAMVGAHKRTDRLRLDIRECDPRTWRYFSKYHYLSRNLPGGRLYAYGLFRGEDQIGFECFANYSFVDRNLYHSNRVVIHPDYVGLGLGVRLATAASFDMVKKGYRVKAKFTSPAMYKHRENHPNWFCTQIKKVYRASDNSKVGKVIKNKGTASEATGDFGRNKKKLVGVKYYHFDFVPEGKNETRADS